MNQFLVKQPHTKTDTPWHQDQSYYIQLPDPRACNLWLALGDVTEEMGCLWFEDSPLDAPIPLRPHRPAGRGGGALQSEGFLERATPTPLRAGSITVHSHLTPHYARGNATDTPRYGYVVQTRPAASVRMARMKGFDHGRCAGNKPRAALAAPPPSRFRVDALAQPLAVGARPRTWGLSLNALAQAHPELTPAYSPWAAAAAEALRATGACYFYHADFTHVTAAAPAPFTNASLAAWTEAERADFAERWRDALEDTIRSPGSGWPAAPFPLTFAALELHDSCAIVKVEDPTGGVAAVRRVFAAAAKHPRLADGGAGAALLARSGYKTPQIVHSTVMRIVAPPSMPDAEFEARWAAVAATWVPVTVTARECAYLVEGVAYQHVRSCARCHSPPPSSPRPAYNPQRSLTRRSRRAPGCCKFSLTLP